MRIRNKYVGGLTLVSLKIVCVLLLLNACRRDSCYCDRGAQKDNTIRFEMNEVQYCHERTIQDIGVFFNNWENSFSLRASCFNCDRGEASIEIISDSLATGPAVYNQTLLEVTFSSNGNDFELDSLSTFQIELTEMIGGPVQLDSVRGTFSGNLYNAVLDSTIFIEDGVFTWATK